MMGRGLALFRSFGSYTAALAEVSVTGGRSKCTASWPRSIQATPSTRFRRVSTLGGCVHL
jgi:hypothetical protein